MIKSLENRLTPLALLLTRVAVGGYFAAAGVHKLSVELNEGLGTFYSTSFKGLQPAWLPDGLAAPYGYALPWLEVVVGVMLVLGLFGRLAAALIGLMIASFTVALALKMGWRAQGADASGAFSSNYIQIAVCFLLTCTGPGSLSLDRLLRGRRAAKLPSDA